MTWKWNRFVKFPPDFLGYCNATPRVSQTNFFLALQVFIFSIEYRDLRNVVSPCSILQPCYYINFGVCCKYLCSPARRKKMMVSILWCLLEKICGSINGVAIFLFHFIYQSHARVVKLMFLNDVPVCGILML